MSDNTCEFCKHWEQAGDAPVGICLKNPPNSSLVMSQRMNPFKNEVELIPQVITFFPELRADQKCHRFALRPSTGE